MHQGRTRSERYAVLKNAGVNPKEIEKIFNKKIYLMLLGAVVPLWLINFYFGQHGTSTVQAPPSEPIMEKSAEPLSAAESPEAVELNGTGIEAGAVKPLGLNCQMDMRARRVGMEGQDIIMVVAEFGMGQCADGS